jgi:hypothetical protein
MTLRRLSARRHTPFGWVEIPSPQVFRWWDHWPLYIGLTLVCLGGIGIGIGLARLWP